MWEANSLHIHFKCEHIRDYFPTALLKHLLLSLENEYVRVYIMHYKNKTKGRKTEGWGRVREKGKQTHCPTNR